MNQKYSVVVSDPCWQYSNWSDKAHGAAISHYSTMSLEELKKIPVDNWQDDNCIHFMWCTLPKMAEGIELLKAWNLEYVTSIIWIKTVPKSGTIRRGIGFWAQGCAEFLMIARKGSVKRDRTDPVIGLLLDSLKIKNGSDKLSRIFYAPIQGHSKKDETVQSWIERTLPGPYLELFSSRERPNWDCWGYSTGYKLTKDGVEKVEKISHKI